jgi:hypothetical protein
MTKRYFVICLFYNILFSIVFFCSGVFSKEYSLTDVSMVEDKAIAYRQKLSSWHVRFSLENEVFEKSSDFDPDKDDERGQLIGMETYKDGDMFRTDRFFILNSVKSRYTIAHGKEWFYQFNDKKMDSGNSTLAVQMTSRKLLSATLGHYNIRLFGFDPNDIRAVPDNFTSFIGNLRRRDIKMIDEYINGELCYKIMFSFIWNEENHCSIWVAPQKGYNPICFELYLHDKKQTSLLNIDVKKDQDSGIWFPASMQTKLTQDNTTLYHGTINVEIISLNKKLNPDLFNEKGLDLPVGTLVLMDPEPPASDTYTWDGEKIVGLSGATLEPFVIPARSNAFRYFLIAAGLALISIACLFKYFELRKRNQNSDNE